MKSEKPYGPHTESDSAFAFAFAMAIGFITLILAAIGVISLF